MRNSGKNCVVFGVAIFLLALLAGIVPLNVHAQEVRIITELNPSTILIGEQTALKVRVVYPSNKSVRLVLPEDTLVSGVEILQSDLVDSLTVNDQLKELVYSVLITSFDSATYQLNNVQALVSGEVFQAEQLPSLIVNTIPVDLEHPEEYADIKEQWSPPFVWQDYLIYFYIFLALILLALFIYLLIRWLKKRKVATIGEVQNVEPLKDPYEEALERILLLKQKELWEQNQVKEYYTELSDILRRYLWRLYGLNTQERTTNEILSDFQHMLGKERMYKELEQILEMADLAKFAKFYPTVGENIALLNATKAFVDEHKPTSPLAEEQDTKGGEKA